MSTERHKGLVRSFFAELNQGHLDIIDQLFAPTFRDRSPGPASPTQIVGREGIKRYFTGYFTAFPDAQFTVKDLIAEGKQVVCYVEAEGTHTGPFLGFHPTKRPIKETWVMAFTFEDQLITESWDIADELTLLRQIGVTFMQQEDASASHRPSSPP
jgi:predicted ester cyclase